MNAAEQATPLYKRTMKVLKAREELGVMGVSDAIFIAGVQTVINRQIDRVRQYGEAAYSMTVFEVSRMEEILNTCETAIRRKLEQIAFAKELAAVEVIAESSDLEEIETSYSDTGATKTIYVSGKSELGNVKWQGQNSTEFRDFMVNRAGVLFDKSEAENDSDSFLDALAMLPRKGIY